MDFPQLPPREVLFRGWGATEKNYSPSLPQKALTDEFRELRATVERMGLMKANHLFFLVYLLHILLLDVAAWLTLWIFGTSLVPFTLCAVLLSTVQVSAFAWSFLEFLVKTSRPRILPGFCRYTGDLAQGESTHCAVCNFHLLLSHVLILVQSQPLQLLFPVFLCSLFSEMSGSGSTTVQVC